MSGGGGEKPTLDASLILKAIETLKARKARPDKTRICCHIERKYGFNRNRVMDVLASSVSDGDVLMVKYKDYYSYRNPDKPARLVGVGKKGSKAKKESTAGVPETNPRMFTIRRMIQAVRRLSKSDPGTGVSPADILSDLHSRKQLTKYTVLGLEEAFRKEAEANGTIKILPSGNIAIASPKKDRGDAVASDENVDDEEDDEEAESDLSTNTEEKQKGKTSTKKKGLSTDEAESSLSKAKGEEVSTRARPLSMRKKKKKSLGPDFLDPSDLGHGYLRGSYEPRCHICKASTISGEQLLHCTKCSLKVHLSCYGHEHELEEPLYKAQQWICNKCKTPCMMCKKQTQQEMIFCEDCNDAYHIECLRTSGSSNLIPPWYCRKCTFEDEEPMEEEGEDKINSEMVIESVEEGDEGEIPNELEKDDNNKQDSVEMEVNLNVKLEEEKKDKEENIPEVKISEDKQIILKGVSKLHSEGDEMAEEQSEKQKHQQKQQPPSSSISSSPSPSTEEKAIEIQLSNITASPVNVQKTESIRHELVDVLEERETVEESGDWRRIQKNKEENSVENGENVNPSDKLECKEDGVKNGEFEREMEEVDKVPKKSSSTSSTSTSTINNSNEFTKSGNGIGNNDLLKSKKDASEWTIDDVECYIKEIGFPDQAPLFKEQEIDGRSLLLLKRMDVLTGLQMKLGPALKIYAHIYRLQGFKLSSYGLEVGKSSLLSSKIHSNRINGNNTATANSQQH